MVTVVLRIAGVRKHVAGVWIGIVTTQSASNRVLVIRDRTRVLISKMW